MDRRDVISDLRRDILRWLEINSIDSRPLSNRAYNSAAHAESDPPAILLRRTLLLLEELE